MSILHNDSSSEPQSTATLNSLQDQLIQEKKLYVELQEKIIEILQDKISTHEERIARERILEKEKQQLQEVENRTLTIQEYCYECLSVHHDPPRFRSTFQHVPLSIRMDVHKALFEQLKWPAVGFYRKCSWLYNLQYDPTIMYGGVYNTSLDSKVTEHVDKCLSTISFEDFRDNFSLIPLSSRIPVHQRLFQLSSGDDRRKHLNWLSKLTPWDLYVDNGDKDVSMEIKEIIKQCLNVESFSSFRTIFRQIPLKERLEIHAALLYKVQHESYQEQLDWALQLSPADLYDEYGQGQDDDKIKQHIKQCLASTDFAEFKSKVNQLPLDTSHEIYGAICKTTWNNTEFSSQRNWLNDIIPKKLLQYYKYTIPESLHKYTDVLYTIPKRDFKAFITLFTSIPLQYRTQIHKLFYLECLTNHKCAHLLPCCLYISPVHLYGPCGGQNDPNANEEQNDDFVYVQSDFDDTSVIRLSVDENVYECLSATTFDEFKIKCINVPTDLRQEVYRKMLSKIKDDSYYEKQQDWTSQLTPRSLIEEYSPIEIKEYVNNCLEATNVEQFKISLFKAPNPMHSQIYSQLYNKSQLNNNSQLGEWVFQTFPSVSEKIVDQWVQRALKATTLEEFQTVFTQIQTLPIRVQIHKALLFSTNNPTTSKQLTRWIHQNISWTLHAFYNIPFQVDNCLMADSYEHFLTRFRQVPIQMRSKLHQTLYTTTQQDQIKYALQLQWILNVTTPGELYWDYFQDISVEIKSHFAPFHSHALSNQRVFFEISPSKKTAILSSMPSSLHQHASNVLKTDFTLNVD